LKLVKKKKGPNVLLHIETMSKKKSFFGGKGRGGERIFKAPRKGKGGVPLPPIHVTKKKRDTIELWREKRKKKGAIISGQDERGEGGSGEKKKGAMIGLRRKLKGGTNIPFPSLGGGKKRKGDHVNLSTKRKKKE